MTSNNDDIINNLLNEKKQILERRRNTPKRDIETLKEINKDYMRIYMKIQYHTDENKRLLKCLSSNNYNKSHNEYNEYQKTYHKEYQTKTKNIIAVS